MTATRIPSIQEVRARLAAEVAECAADTGDQFCTQCEGHRETIRVLDAVVPLLGLSRTRTTEQERIRSALLAPFPPAREET